MDSLIDSSLKEGLCQLQFTLLDRAKGKVSRTEKAVLVAPHAR